MRTKRTGEVMTKSSVKHIVVRLQNEKKLAQEAYRNVTFRIKRDQLEAFKKKCKKLGLKMNPVVEEFVKEFLDSDL